MISSSIVSMIVTLVIAGLIFWLVLWFVDYIGVPQPFNKVIKVVVGLFALIFLVNFLLGLAGTPLFR